MMDFSNVNKTAMIRNAAEKATYEINGRRYTFTIVCYDGGVPYGYCKSRGWWAHLYDKYVDVNRLGLMAATQISSKKV